MPRYLFTGTVLPERALLTLSWEVKKFIHISTGNTGRAQVSILLNQVAAWIEADQRWDIFDLRNVVRNLIQTHLSMIGFIRGFAYDLAIARVLCPEENVDHVFGIDIACIPDRGKDLNLQTELERLCPLTSGPLGIFIDRCFSDLVSAMKHADDTGFYCYRAIESLRHHCASKCGLEDSDRAIQWTKFRELAKCTEDEIRQIKSAADPIRHGKPAESGALDRAALLVATWAVVDRYLAAALGENKMGQIS